MNRMTAFTEKMCQLLIAFAILSFSAYAQQRYTSGPWKGFQMGRPEGYPLSFSPAKRGANLNGTVKLDGGRFMPGVAVELRGPGEKTDILVTKTDAKGHFAFQGVPDGSYKLKTTMNGYGSAVGQVNIDHTLKDDPLPLKIRYAI